MLMPHSTPLAPLCSFPRGVHLRLLSSPSPPLPLFSPSPTTRWPPPLRVCTFGESIRGGAGPSGSALDALLSAAELLCLAPPAICSAVCVVRLILPPAGPVKPFATLASGRLFVVQYVLLVAAVAIGALIRRRQWGRLCRVGGGGTAATGCVDLVGRVEKVEESVRGVVASVGVLSRTVEKLGVRFRVLRRTLRDPISEEQQEKQLELILAIGEASRILDDKQDLLDEETGRSSNLTSEKENQRAKIKAETVTGGNNRP